MDIIIIDGDRKESAFSNTVVNWKYGIKYGPRYENMAVSRKKYKTPDAAKQAGKAQLKILLASLVAESSSP